MWRRGRWVVWGAVLAVVLVAGSCSAPPPVAVTFATLGEHPDGTRVILSGDLGLVPRFEAGNDLSCVSLRDPDGTATVRAWIRHRDPGMESQPNRMEALGPMYGPDDLLVWRADGSAARIGDRITVTATLRYTDAGSPYLYPVTLIEG